MKCFFIFLIFLFIQLLVIQEISIADKVNNTNNNQKINSEVSPKIKDKPSSINKESHGNNSINDKRNNCNKQEANSNICKPE